MPATLALEKKVEVYALYDEGHNVTDISKRVGINRETVYSIIRSDVQRFRHLVDAIKRGHADDCYALGKAIRDKTWEGLEKVEVKTAGDLRNMAVSSAVFVDKGLAIEGKAPGQTPSAFNLYLSADGSAVQVNISGTEARNLVKEKIERDKLDSQRTISLPESSSK